MRKFGFTLAEVLITLTIIGIIAAVTLPALKTNIDKQALSTQVAKMYSQIEEGLKTYEAIEGSNPNDMDMTEFAKKYLEVAYVCVGRTDTKCFAEFYTNIDGNKKFDQLDLILLGYSGGAQGRAYLLKDGSTIGIMTLDNANYIEITVDVNGTKGPNKLGYDLHLLRTDANGRIKTNGFGEADPFDDPEADKKDLEQMFEDCKAGKTIGNGVYGCMPHLIKNSFKIDY